MKLNRKWLLAIALVLSLTMAISGTLAYLTDRDTVENVFTMGNVDIEVEEEFDQNSPLYPGVEVDKEAGITNTHATEPAYVWMVVSVPNDLAQYIELGWAGSYSATEVTSPHAGYTGYLVKYPSALTAGSSTENILESVKLASNVDYQEGVGYVAVSGGQTTPIGDLSDVKIMVDGFAIQTEGFDGVDAAYTAYTTQWGGLTGGESGTGGEGGEEPKNGDDPSVTYPAPEEAVEVADVDALKEAIANGSSIIKLADGEWDIPSDCAGKTLSLYGSKNAVLKLTNEGEDGCDYGFGSAGSGVGNITFNGLTIDTTENDGNYKGYAYMGATFNDCSFVGAYSLNNANDFTFNYCDFDFKNGYLWTWAANNATFNNCTFNENGNSKCILAHGSASTNITINNCKFAAIEQGSTWDGNNTACVEIDPTGTNAYTINFTGYNSKTESYSGWTRVKDESTGHTITGLE